MKTLVIAEQAVVSLSATAQPIFSRFVWKEFRMLRGFWLAVAGLAVLEQYVSTQMMFDVHAVPGWMFASAWGAAALYAVGASVTMFSAESEDGTRDFLQQLPGRWQPILAGKLTAGIASTLVLAGLLCITGWMIAGRQWPTSAAIQTYLAIGGVALLETTAWGLFFSLKLRQPLLAAIATISAASIGAQLAIEATPHSQQAFTAAAYESAVPYRFLLIAMVFVADVWLAARWLQPHSDRRRAKKSGLDRDGSMASARVSSSAIDTQTGRFHNQRRRLISRLLWQTWHESWQTMLAVIPLALFLMVGMSLPADVMVQATPGFDLPIPLLGALYLPALFGALVFRADQRGSHREFLAAHAGRPRYLWLVRHAVWLAGLLMVGVFLHAAGWLLLGMFSLSRPDLFLSEYLGNFSVSNWQMVRDATQTAKIVMQATFAGWIALLTAYSIGQLCSLLLRREVLAGFLALLLSVVLTAWVIAAGFWQLSPWWFVLPLGMGAMLASWLRMPGWLVGRNTIRAWLLPLAAVATPLVIFALLLPSARLAQLENLSPQYPYFSASLPKIVNRFESQNKQGKETADAYFRLSSEIVPQDEAAGDITIDNINWDDMPGNVLQYEMANMYGGHGELISNPLTPWQRELSKILAVKKQLAYIGANRQVIEELIELSRQPLCRFPGSVLSDGSPTHRQLGDLKELLFIDARLLQADGELDAALDRYLALLRIESHTLSSQPTSLMSSGLPETKPMGTIDEMIIHQWATHPDQTGERLRAAITKLETCSAMEASPRDAILAVRQYIRASVQGTKQPISQIVDHPRWSQTLAWLANRLPWESQRALLALDLKTSQTLNYLNGAMHRLGNPSTHYAKELRRLVLEASRSGAPEPNQILYDSAIYSDHPAFLHYSESTGWTAFAHASKSSFQASTSYLVTQELHSWINFRDFLSRYVNSEIARHGLKLQLALLAYRLDHQKYPETLSELVPDYLATLPLDPYSGEAFQYRPDGSAFPLQTGGQYIFADTPVFWSVGSGNCVLSEEIARHDSYGDRSQNDEDDKAGLPYAFRFQPTERDLGEICWPLVFTLPK